MLMMKMEARTVAVITMGSFAFEGGEPGTTEFVASKDEDPEGEMLATTGVIASVDEDIDGYVLVIVIVDPSGFVLVRVPMNGVVGTDE